MEGNLLAAIAQHHADLAALYRALAERDHGAHGDGDRVVGLPEAATRLGVSVSWLSRRASWARVGGFKGPDRRIKFRMSALERHLTAQKH